MLPVFYPTTVLFVDDDPRFLESCAFRYGDQFPCAVERSPEQALRLVEEHAAAWTIRWQGFQRQAFLQGGDWANRSTLYFQFDTGAVVNIVADADRFNAISVAVVDFAMPSMSGLELCRRMKQLPIKKILLTGKAGEETAVDAFNEGLISQFLIKQDPGIGHKLPREIERLQTEFFLATEQGLIGNCREGPLSFLTDSLVVSQLRRIASDCGSVEHFVTSSPSGVLFLSATGKATLVTVYDDDTMRAHHETALASRAPDELVAKFDRREIVAHFPTPTGFYEPSLSRPWTDFVAAARQVDGDVASWWIAVTDSTAPLPLDRTRIVGLESFKASRR